MRLMRHLLDWYNNLDVEPFLLALKIQWRDYHQRGIDTRFILMCLNELHVYEPHL